jgi:hypothetical protein
MERVDYINEGRIADLFKLKQVQYEQRDLEFLCNQFIHSFVFATVENDDGSLAGFFISSDRSCQRKVYFLELSQVLNAFRTVGRDYPANIQVRRNAKTQQWEHLPEEP